jgi:hypothetical protein
VDRDVSGLLHYVEQPNLSDKSMLSALTEQALKPARFKLVVADVEPLVFEFGSRSIRSFSSRHTNNSISKIDNILHINDHIQNADTMFLIPVTIDDDFRNDKTGLSKMLLKRVSSECAINGFATLSKMALALRKAAIACYGLAAWKSNPFIRMLAHYLSSIKHESDPFLENSTGIITTPKFNPRVKDLSKEDKEIYMLQNAPIFGDTMVSTRCLLLVNSAFFYFSKVMPSSEMPAMVEIVKYLFQSPFANSDSLKSVLSLLKQKAFGLAPRTPSNLGFEYVFPEPGAGPSEPLNFSSSKYPNASHNFFYSVKEPYYESLDALTLISPLAADRYHMLLTSVINHETLEIAKWWMLPETVIGFVDNSTMHTAIKQYADAPILEGPAPIHEAVKRTYKDLIYEGLTTGKVPRTYDEMVNSITRYAVTTSSGLGRVKVNIKDPGSRKIIPVAVGSKLAALLSRGNEIFSKEFLNKQMSMQYPAKAGVRKTVARKKRIIGNVSYTIIGFESVLASIQDEYSRNNINFGTTGATSNPFNDTKLFINGIPFMRGYFCRDADGWDAKFQLWNGRKAKLDAILEIPDAAWPAFDFEGFKTVKEMITLVMAKYMDIILEVRDMNFAPPLNADGTKQALPLRSKVILQLFTIMISGALSTFFDNSVANLEISKSLYHAMVKAGIRISEAFRVLFSSVTGDDAADILHILGDPSVELVQKMLSFNTQYMLDNGHVTKDVKTTFSPTLDYLKKLWIGNCHVPRPSIQPYSKEHKNISDSKIETISSRWGLFNAIISRGADIKFMHTLILSEWNMIRYLDNSTFGAKLGEKNFVDFFSVFLPPSYGGAGIPFFPSVGYGLLSNDFLSLLYPDFRARLVNVKSIISPIVERTNMIRSISKEPDVIRVFDDGIKFAVKGIKPRRLETAKFLLDHYDEELTDVKLNGLSILDYDKQLLNAISETIGNSIPKRFHIQMMKKALVADPKSDVLLSDTSIYMKFKYTFMDEIVPPKFESIPIAGLDRKLYHLYQICGITDRDFSNSTAVDRAIRGLTAHGLPRQVSAEALVNTLTAPKLIGNLELQAVVLTIMGVDYPQASSFILNYARMLPFYSILSSNHGISLGTESLSGLYMGDSLIPRISEIDVALSDREIRFLQPAIVYLFIQGYFLHGEARKILISQKSKTKTSQYRREIYTMSKKADMSTLDSVLETFYADLDDRKRCEKLKLNTTRIRL